MNLKKTIALLQSSLPSFLMRLNPPPRPSPPSQTHSTKVNRELKQQRRRRLRKRHLKSEVALLQTFYWCRILNDCDRSSGKERIKLLSWVHVLHKT